jgi:hypothetical protein
LSRLFWVQWVWTCHSDTRVWLMLSSLNTCLIIARVTITLWRFAQDMMHAHCSFVGSTVKSRQAKYTTPNKNQHVHPSAWNVVHWLPRYASTIIYCCIALLQLLYRWQYQSQKL